MSDERIAWLDLHTQSSWQNENAPEYLTREAVAMISSAQRTSKVFDWNSLQENAASALRFFEFSLWYDVISSVLGMDFGWDNGRSWLPELLRQLQWEAPLQTAWYDIARPLSAHIDRRLLWTWILQSRLIERFSYYIDSPNEARTSLVEYRNLRFADEFIPPSVLDCMVEIEVVYTLDGQVMPLRLIYRKRTPSETMSEEAEVVITWR